MLFLRQSIYNTNLLEVAIQIQIESTLPSSKQNDFILFDEFFTMLSAELVDSQGELKPLKLIVPYAFISYLDEKALSFKAAICVYLDEPSNSLVDEILTKGYHLALDETADEMLKDRASFIFSPTENQSGMYTDKMVATDVADYHSFESLGKLGALFFQGPFIDKPHKTSEQPLSTNQASVLTLLSALTKKEMDLNEVTSLLGSDSVLSYRLLKVINGPAMRGQKKIESLQEAVVRFGQFNLKKWVMVLSFSAMENKPLALMRMAMQRALMCAKSHEVDAAKYYTAGLLSSLDAFLDTKIEKLLSDIEISQDIKQAILHFEGELGQTLKSVIDYQHGAMGAASEALIKLDIETAAETNALLTAIQT